MAKLSDTSPEVERLMADAYRRMPPEQKWANLLRDFRFARAIHAAGMRHRHPGISLQDIQADWIQQVWGSPSPIPIPEQLMEPSQQDFQPALDKVVDVFESLDIGYAIGGSIASSFHGYNRMTNDADITAEPFPTKIKDFVAAFPKEEYFLALEAVELAIRTRSTFNILHPTTGYKIDVFIRKDDEFEQSAFTRRESFRLPVLPNRLVRLHSPEDIILFKLRWYVLGGQVSDRQWNDIQGVMKTQSERLDLAYLHKWADELGVGDLLVRALAEAGLTPF